MNKVYVIQEGNNDYAPAEKFGEVNFITKSDLRNIEPSQQNNAVYFDIAKLKADYIPGTDYIIPVGNPALVALVFAALGKVQHKLLKWDGRLGDYILFNINPEKVK